jgi:hypothetical protein
MYEKKALPSVEPSSQPLISLALRSGGAHSACDAYGYRSCDSVYGFSFSFCESRLPLDLFTSFASSHS